MAEETEKCMHNTQLFAEPLTLLAVFLQCSLPAEDHHAVPWPW